METTNSTPRAPCPLGEQTVLRMTQLVGSLKKNTTLEYSTRVVQEGDRRCEKSTLNDLAYLTPLRIPLMNPVTCVCWTGENAADHILEKIFRGGWWIDWPLPSSMDCTIERLFTVRRQSYLSRLPKYWPPIPLSTWRVCPPPPQQRRGYTKEVIKEQSTPWNLSATATRVLLCTYMPCCSFSKIFFSYSHLTSPQLTSHLI
jgi:hypothetical protein